MAGKIVFIAISIIIISGTAILVPKRLTKIEIYASCLFVALLQIVLDTILDLRYDLYGYFYRGLDLGSFIVFLGLYPGSAVLILNYYPFHRGIRAKVAYVILVSFLSAAYEFLSVKNGYFYYNGWSILLSLLCYPAMICTLVCNLTLVRKLLREN